MSKSKNKRPQCAEWERKPGERHFHRLYDGLIDSPAFLDLTHRQQMLFIRFMQRCTFIPHDDGTYETNNGDIHFTQTEYTKFYGYRDTKQWMTDLRALQSHGFVKVEFNGKNVLRPSKYKLLPDWQKWVNPTANIESAAAPKSTERNGKRSDK